MTDLNEFSQRVLADQRELDADPTPQTPTYALLAEERLEEAEAVARRTVAELDGHIEDALSPRLVLLSEALIAHGITLARLKKPEQHRPPFNEQSQWDIERALSTKLVWQR